MGGAPKSIPAISHLTLGGTTDRADVPIGNAQRSLLQQRDRWFESGSLQRRVMSKQVLDVRGKGDSQVLRDQERPARHYARRVRQFRTAPSACRPHRSSSGAPADQVIDPSWPAARTIGRRAKSDTNTLPAAGSNCLNPAKMVSQTLP